MKANFPSTSPAAAWISALPAIRALPALGVLVALVFALYLMGCSEEGGPNTTFPFRVVLIEPTPLSTNIPCTDTIRVTFNQPIDTTAVFDDEAPRYFVAGINSGAAFDGPGTFLSNSGRTINLPFTFQPSTNFTFSFLQARGEGGENLETQAQTTFETAPSGQQGCP